MARTRLLKPLFFKNEFLAGLSPHARLLFSGLWCLADCEGRLEDRPLRIKAEIFPFEEVDVDALLTELAASSESFIVRYEAEGSRLIQITNFTKHQNPHKNERQAGSRFPEYQEKDGTSTVQVPSRDGSAPALTLNPSPLTLHGDDFSKSSEFGDVKKERNGKNQKGKSGNNGEENRGDSGHKNAFSKRFSEESRQLVQEFQELLKSHGVTTFRRDWSLTSYASCEALLKQGKTPEAIRPVMRWAVEEWGCSKSVVHFKHVVSAWPHWERQNSTSKNKKKQDFSRRDALLEFPMLRHRLTGETFETALLSVDDAHPHSLFFPSGSLDVTLLEGYWEEVI